MIARECSHDAVCRTGRRSDAPSAWVCCAFLAAGTFAQTNRPASLEHITRERERWRSARMEWVQLKSPVGKTPRYYESKFSGPDRIVVFRGDDEGVIWRDADGKPHENGYGPISTLIRNGQWFEHADSGVIATLTDLGDSTVPLPDIRVLGLTAHFSYFDIETSVWGDDKNCQYSEERSGDVRVVIRKCDAETTRWWLDPQRGGLPVRVTYEIGGRIASEASVTLARFGDLWFPETVEFYKGSADGAAEPDEIVQVLNVEANPSDLPPRFTPADIGMDAGVNVVRRDSQMCPSPSLYRWDGEKLITSDEYSTRRVRPGPIFLARTERARALTAIRNSRAQVDRSDHPPAVAALLSDWEAYTLRFIERYRLDAEQAQRAMLVLDQANAAATDFAVTNRAKLDELEADRARVESLAEPQRTKDARAWDERRREMLAPLDAIFRDRLSPGLEKLPTRAQRALGSPSSLRARAMSQPASASSPTSAHAP